MRFGELEIRPPKRTDPAKAFRDFICELVDEETFILVNRKPGIKEEEAWLKDKLNGIRRREQVTLTAWDGGKLVGSCEAAKGRFKDESNVSIGISVRKAYRGRGLGERLLRSTIILARQRLRPRNIFLHVSAPNKPAMSLYKKVGFREFARFPKWHLHKGEYVDGLYMILRKQ